LRTSKEFGFVARGPASKGLATVIVKHRQSNAFLGTWKAKGLEGDLLVLPARSTTTS